MLKYNYYQVGKPLKLLIFLYGYNSTADDYQYATDRLLAKISNAVVVIPQAPQTSEKNPLKYQWFGMQKYDPENKRTQARTSVEEIFSIYNKAQKDVSDCAQTVNQFIDDMQKQYGNDNTSTYLIGFSQGAMLALYTALCRPQKLAGAFCLSGLAAAADLLAKNINSAPKIYLFHGKKDMKVQYKTLPHSVKWLQTHGINPQVQIYDELAHKICEAEINIIAEQINNARA